MKKTYLVNFFPMPRQPIGKILDLGVTKGAKKKVKRCQTWRNKILGISVRSGLKGLEIRPRLSMINNGNKTEWSPIRSAIIRNQTSAKRGSDLLITSMMTDRIRRHGMPCYQLIITITICHLLHAYFTFYRLARYILCSQFYSLFTWKWWHGVIETSCKTSFAYFYNKMFN